MWLSLILRRGDYPGLSRWTLDALTCALIWEKLTGTCTQGRRCEDGAETEAVASQGMPTAFRSWKRQGADSPTKPPEEVQPCGHLDFELLASRTVTEKNFCSFKFKIPPRFCILLCSPENDITTCIQMPMHLHRWNYTLIIIIFMRTETFLLGKIHKVGHSSNNSHLPGHGTI